MNLDEAERDGRMGSQEPFERNRYFEGKLMTAQDMRVEQQYHAERLNTICKSVVGEGIVYGLKPEITEGEEDTLEVTVQPGLAIDGYGRPIVVTEETSIEKKSPSGTQRNVYLYLSQRTTPWESVRKLRSEYTNGDACEHNRVLELFKLELKNEKAPDDQTKELPEIALPTKSETEIDDPNQVLNVMARSYYEQKLNVEDTNAPSNSTVLLGSFERSTDGSWGDATFDQGPLVYNNDMLYTILARHISDFGDPHGVAGEYPSPQTATEDRGDGEFNLTSSDGSIRIMERTEDSETDITVAEVIQDDLRSLYRYHRKAALHRLRWTFDDAFTIFDSVVAEEIHREITDALESHDFADEDAFLEFSEEILTLNSDFEDELEDVVTEASLERYSAALIELREAIEEEAQDLQVINAQYVFSEAVQRLEKRVVDPGDLTIDVLPGIRMDLMEVLREKGIMTVSDLSILEVEDMMNYMDVSEALTSLWIDKARELTAD